MCVLLYIEVTILIRCCGGARLWNPSAQEVEAGELLQVQGQPGLHNEYSVLQLWVPGTELRSSGLVAGPFIHGATLWPSPSLSTELLVRWTCQGWVKEKLLCVSKSAWSLACPHASVHLSWVYRATHGGWEMGMWADTPGSSQDWELFCGFWSRSITRLEVKAFPSHQPWLSITRELRR